MPKIVCGCLDCKYNSDKNTCMLRSIKLKDCYYHTKNEGFKHFQVCKNYEQDESIEQLQKELKNFFSDNK